MKSKLSGLQHDVLHALRSLEPRFTLTGGAALAGYHLGHRATRDLDLFIYGHHTLGQIPRDAAALLQSSGWTVDTVQTTPTFHRIQVSGPNEQVLVDLVAEPVPQLEEAEEREPGILVDRPGEILVNKVCALLGRMEIRDLEDTRALVDAGYDLPRALADAPKKEGGFSPPTLAWVLSRVPVAKLAASEGFDGEVLEQFRAKLVSLLLGKAPGTA